MDTEEIKEEMQEAAEAAMKARLKLPNWKQPLLKRKGSGSGGTISRTSGGYGRYPCRQC